MQKKILRPFDLTAFETIIGSETELEGNKKWIVTFYNGSRQEIYVRDHFKPFSSSRWIDLRGKRRCIKKIVVVGDADTYRRTGFRKQAKVLFYGR